MKNRDIIVLHEYGAPNHYIGLTAESSINVIFIEFSVMRGLAKSIIKKDKNLFIKHISNFLWLMKALINPSLNKGKKVVLGMAPFDYRILFLDRILKYSEVAYHSSWTEWDGSNFPKKNLFLKKTIRNKWVFLLEKKVNSIAAVTNKTKNEIKKNFNISSPVITVYHSYSNVFSVPFCYDKKYNSIKILYIGRLVHQKGIEKIINLSKIFPDIEFSLVGEDLEKKFENLQQSNIKYLGFIKDKEVLKNICDSHDIILMPSIRIPGWEELFGISLIEAMSRGCVPLVTDHMGPKEIISDSTLIKNIFTEDEYIHKSTIAIKAYMNSEKLLWDDKLSAKSCAENFSQEKIKLQWLKVIKSL